MEAFALNDNIFYKQIIDVRGTDIVFVIYQNADDNYWYFDLKKPNGTDIIYGEKIISGLDIGYKTDYKGLYVLKGDGTEKDPNADGLSNYYLVVLTDAQIIEYRETLPIDPTYLITDDSYPIVDDFGRLLVADDEII